MLLVHVSKAFALPKLSERATRSPTYSIIYQHHNRKAENRFAVMVSTQLLRRGIRCCFVFDNLIRSCEVLETSSQSVSKRLIIYLCFSVSTFRFQQKSDANIGILFGLLMCICLLFFCKCEKDDLHHLIFPQLIKLAFIIN